MPTQKILDELYVDTLKQELEAKDAEIAKMQHRAAEERVYYADKYGDSCGLCNWLERDACVEQKNNQRRDLEAKDKVIKDLYARLDYCVENMDDASWLKYDQWCYATLTTTDKGRG